MLLRTQLSDSGRPDRKAPVDAARDVPVLRVPEWDAIPGLVHGFYGRRGGVSGGAFAELNLSFRVGDAPEAVEQNWRRVQAATDGTVRFVTMRQVHGTDVAVVGPETLEMPVADALVTASPGLALSGLTADCVPMLLVAPPSKGVAAVHAGWRGTLAGVPQRVLAALQEKFAVQPQGIYAALGPAVGGCCYEIEASIADALEARWGVMPDAVRRDDRAAKKPAKAHLDLRRVNAAILARAGVPPDQIVSVGPCTCCNRTEYFSYRATNGTTGRQLSFIGWHD